MIPFLDLKRQYGSIADTLEPVVLEVLRSGSYVLGDPVAKFERAFAAYCGTDHAVATSNGTSALHLALLAAEIGRGDEVITVPTTFVATVAAILYSGATPVLVDVDPVTLTMDPALIEAAITPRTRAIMPVHFHGRLADMTGIVRIAEAHDLLIIEDAAQAHGARQCGRRAGAFGSMGCFSFYPGKNLGAAGEGGAVTTSDPELAARLRAFRDWGQVERSVHALRGYNYRMDAIQGAVLGVKLAHLETWTGHRQQIARAYDAGLSDRVRRPAAAVADEHVWHVYAVCVDDRDALRAQLANADVATNIHYPRPVHLQPAYSDLAAGRGSFPIAEAYADHTLSLPIFAELRRDEVDAIIAAVNAAVAPRNRANRPCREPAL